MSNYKILTVFCIGSVFVIVFLIGDIKASDSKIVPRVKRFLGFRNISRFFVRVNWKNNMVSWNQFFAEAIGYKLSYDDPPDSFHGYKHFQRREVYDQLEYMIDKIGVNGFHCIRRAVCEIKTLKKPEGIYHRILQIVFKHQSSSTDRWHRLSEEDCGMSSLICPFSVLDVSMYTDI